VTATQKKFPVIRTTGATLILVASTWCTPVRGGEIHEAAELGNLDKVKAALAQDPKQINSTDAKGRTVLTRAALSGKRELVVFLLEQGATEDIFAAAITGHTDKIAALLKEDPKLVSTKDSSGRTALHWAALYGQKPAVETLLAGKADVNLRDGDGFTALHWAVMFEKNDVAEVLLANKADTSIKVAKFGWTPLRLAVIHGRTATAQVLLKGGADPNLKDEDNIPLLHQAVISGKKEMVELLLAYKCDINLKDAEGETPLAEAIEQGNKAMIGFLRQHGAKEK
jgi:ankyrin repeat protein